jgi:anaerobic ribonucleoside-triphosphate reductase
MGNITCSICEKELQEKEEYMPYKDGHIKCKACHQKNPLGQFQKTEVYSRIVGYIRPVSQWNKGKKQEFKDRKTYINGKELDQGNDRT